MCLCKLFPSTPKEEEVFLLSCTVIPADETYRDHASTKFDLNRSYGEKGCIHTV